MRDRRRFCNVGTADCRKTEAGRPGEDRDFEGDSEVVAACFEAQSTD